MPSLYIMGIVERPYEVLSWILIVVFSICVHEYSHARMALSLGDDTAAMLGHLSLNPLKQMGPISLMILLVAGIAWGAVPVDVRRLRKRGAMAMVSFAGPAANLLLCLAAAVLAAVFARVPGTPMVSAFFVAAAAVNGILFVLNMLPLPMLDGWQVFALLVPGMKHMNPAAAQNISLLALVVLWTTPAGNFIWSWGGAIAVWAMAAVGRLPGLGA